MAEFHFDDPVVNVKTGRAFLVKGMMKSPTASVLYCGDEVGWTPEAELDHNVTELQRADVEQVERLIHTIRESAGDMTAKLLLLKKDFGGMLPRPLMVELEAIVLMLQAHLKL